MSAAKRRSLVFQSKTKKRKSSPALSSLAANFCLACDLVHMGRARDELLSNRSRPPTSAGSGCAWRYRMARYQTWEKAER